jgi:hypothetical protein
VRSSRASLACKRATSPASAFDRAGLPGFDAANAAIAPSRATARNREITDRSTPASTAASAWEICPVSIRTHKSYFCSAVKNGHSPLSVESS